MAAEYTGIGGLFSEIIGVSPLIPILTVGIVTLIYTTFGGLFVSIVTDMYQSIFTCFLLVVIMIYVAITFRPSSFGPLPPQLSANESGYSSIITLGFSLITSTFFSDAVWQRVWAAKDNATLKKASILGGSLVIFVIFMFGLGAFIATWAGYTAGGNIAFFALLKNTWIVVVVAIITITMNESAVDSLQNAVADTVTSLGLSLGLEIPLFWTRVLVVVLNVPIIIVGLQGYNIASIFLITNMMTTCSILPLIFGMMERFENVISEYAALFSNLFAFLMVLIYGFIRTVIFRKKNDPLEDSYNVKGIGRNGIIHVFLSHL